MNDGELSSNSFHQWLWTFSQNETTPWLWYISTGSDSFRSGWTNTDVTDWPLEDQLKASYYHARTVPKYKKARQQEFILKK